MPLKKLINQKENQDLEFKEVLPDSKKVAQLVTALYNSKGGTIIIGVNDDKQPIGIKDQQKTEHKFIQIIRHWCRLVKKPDYADKDGSFTISFNGPGRTEKPLEKTILNELNERQIKALNYIKTNMKINRTIIAKSIM